MSKETTFDFPPKGHVSFLGYDDGNDQFVAIACDANGRPEIVIPLEEALEARMYGHIGGSWQRQPLIPGYSDVVVEALSELNAVVGINTLDTTAVPAGEVHMIQTAYAVNATTNPTVVLLALRRNSTNYGFHREAAPGAGASVENRNPIILEEGDAIRATWTGCALNDDLYLTITGYKFDIDL